MAFCTNCGMKLDEGAKFCTNCGAKVEEQSTQAEYGSYESEPEREAPQPKEGAVCGEYSAPYGNTYGSYGQSGDYDAEKNAARRKKNRTVIIAICAVAAVALVLIIVILVLMANIMKADGKLDSEAVISESSESEISYGDEEPTDETGFVSSTTEFKENTYWYGFAEISDHYGDDNYSEGVYEVWGIIGKDDNGRNFFELYDNYDLEGGPLLSYWIELYPSYVEADIGDEDAWLLNIYLIEDDEPYFSFWLDNGAIEVWFPYEFEGESFDFSFFLREEGAEWDEANDPYIP